MILPAQRIRHLCITRGMVKPFTPRTVRFGSTYGLGPAGYDVRIQQSVELWPGRFMLASTIESFDLPDSVLGRVHDKSTWARRGLSLFNTILDPGWRGEALTLELKNVGDEFIKIPCGAPIAHIVFEDLSEATEQPYRGKYQDQAAHPVAAIQEADHD